MKIRTKTANTERALLDMVRRLPMVTVHAMVLALWPSTKQAAKKARTVTMHLRRLDRMGYVSQCGPSGGWLATAPRRARCIKDATSPPAWDIGGPGAEECSTGS